MLRTYTPELLIPGFEPRGIELGFEAKMVWAMAELQRFELGVGEPGREEVVGRDAEIFGGRVAHRRTLFE